MTTTQIDTPTLPAPTSTFEGKVSAHPRGFGFVRCDDGQDFFLPPPQMKTLIPGDRIRFTVALNPRNGQMSASLQSLVTRPETFWLGQPRRHGQGYALVSDDALPVTLRFSSTQPLSDFDVVQVRVAAESGKGLLSFDAELVDNLGPRNDRDFDVRYALAKFRIPLEFSEQALAEARAFGEPTLEEAAALGVLNMTDIPFATIDGDSTRDFDDAVFFKAGETGSKLYVAIADVARYVTPGSALDSEAAVRGTSVYMSDRVVPMLPPELSNGLCSLNPGALRYARVCVLDYSREGKLQGYEFCEAVIRSASRLTYDQVEDRVYPEGTPEAVSQMLVELWAWFGLQKLARAQRGLMEFPSAEPKLRQGEDGSFHLEWLQIRESNGLVEECMLAANRAAAARLAALGAGMLFRHQDGLDVEKWAEAREWLVARGLDAPGQPTLMDLRNLLRSVDGTPLAEQVAFRIRRAMTPAVYDELNSSHFSLGFEEYAHFTSPIRRYADLALHRMLQALGYILGRERSEHISQRSRVAKQASRFPWERLKRRLVWRAGVKAHRAQIISQSGKGLRGSLEGWDVLAAVDAVQLEQAGWVWNRETEGWEKGATRLDLGMRIDVELLELIDEGPSCDLNCRMG